MASDAEKAGDADKAAQYTPAAETIADQLIQVERDVESLKTMVIESTQASDQAKAAVQQNSRLLQEKIAEKSKLLSQLDQAKMQEEMNVAMDQLNETVGDDVPTLKEVEEKIQARYAKAKASAELRDVGRVTGARDRAGDRQRRGAEPPVRAAGRARPRRRHPAGAAGRGRNRLRPFDGDRPAPPRISRASGTMEAGTDLGDRPAPPRITAGASGTMEAGTDLGDRFEHDQVVAVDDLVDHAGGQVGCATEHRP